jgi:two-component system, OmpR family, KDP operon response regulator KdpE
MASNSERPKRILVVDDERQIVRALRVGLTAHGYEVLTASNGDEALDLAASTPPDAVILDLGLPGIDGLEVCRTLREWASVPILVLSARTQEREKVAALDLGADDYITKPFGMDELLARLRAALRRAAAIPPAEAILQAGDLRIDFSRRLVTVAGQEVHLTPTEYSLLKVLATNPDRVLTHGVLLRSVWGSEYGEEAHYLRVFVRQLRQKIEPDPSRPRHILTEPGVGYRFRLD